jgi:hypothetical protein
MLAETSESSRAAPNPVRHGVVIELPTKMDAYRLRL